MVPAALRSGRVSCPADRVRSSEVPLLFPILVLLVFGLQVLHRRLLRRALPPRWHRFITPFLLAIHAPLALYMGLRMVGFSDWSFVRALNPLARFGLAFQAFTLLHLVVWAGVTALWALWCWVEDVPEQGPEDPGRRRFLQTSLAGGMGALSLSAGLGVREAYGEVEVVRLDVESEDLPVDLEGLKIVHLTDLHAGPLLPERRLRHWRAVAERERPDLLVFTGDFVDSRSEELKPLLEAFRDFPAPLGRFAVLGNHDYFQDPRPIWDGLAGIGVTCLENRGVLLERGTGRLGVVGLQDPMACNGRFQGLHFGPGPDPGAATASLPPGIWTLCLTHRPTDWCWARQTGARLTLAGHTHGGQINLIPGVSSARLLGPWTHGLYREGGQALYVSRGLGVVGLPIRLGAPPEVTVLTLRRSELPTLNPERTVAS